MREFSRAVGGNKPTSVVPLVLEVKKVSGAGVPSQAHDKAAAQQTAIQVLCLAGQVYNRP
jgi:hypothetical protein